MKWIPWLLGLAIGIVFVRLDPATTVQPDVVWPALRAVLVTVAWMAAAIGAGGALVQRLSPTVLSSPIGWAHSLVSGILIWGLGGLLLGAVGGLNTVGFIVLFALMASGWLTRPQIAVPTLPSTAWLLGTVVLFPGLIGALAPATATDAIYYHLAIPEQLLMDGKLVGGLLMPQGSRPLSLHLPYAALLHAGGAMAPALFHWLLSACTVLTVFQMGRAHFNNPTVGAAAALLLGGSWTFVHETSQLGNDIPTAFAVLCALDAALRGHAKTLAVASAAALSLKYTAAGPITGIFLIATLSWKSRIRMGVVALALVAPWWIRNMMEGLHPLFPFMAWPDVGHSMVFVHLDKYGLGRSIVDMLMLPWNTVMHAELNTFTFLGRLNPAFLVLAPFALWHARKPSTEQRVVVVACICAIAWAMGPHWLRYLITGLPIVALAAASGIAQGNAGRSVAGAALLAGVLGLPANSIPLFEDTADRMAVVTGSEPQDAYLKRHLTGYKAIEWANTHLPQDAQVAMLFSWTRAHLKRKQVLGSVEDHIPTRHWLLTHQASSLQELRKAGATHAIVRHTRFLPNAYPFLTKKDFSTAFQAPLQTLDDALLMQANLLYADGKMRVFALPNNDH